MNKDQYLQENFGLAADDVLIEDFSCFYDASLIQPAHMYLTKYHLCFHVHGHKQVHYAQLTWKNICDLKKKNTARVIPNAVVVETEQHQKHFFAFVNRSHCYKAMHRLWLGKDHTSSCTHEHDHEHSSTLSPLSGPYSTVSEQEYVTTPRISESGSSHELVIEANTTTPIEDVYELNKILGTGAFSVVKLAQKRATGETFAVKIVDKEAVAKDKKEMLEREVDILKRIQHPNIIAVKEIYETPKYLYLIMELATGGELFDAIVKRGKYSEKDAAKIVHQIVSAIEYLHHKGIVHRDLKPENLLIASKGDDVIKIADFGLSKIMEASTVMLTACGTPGYVAPEVLKGEGYHQEVDVWSIGVIMYILLCGFPPFYGANNTQLFEKIMAGTYWFPSPYWDPITPSAKDLIKKLLVVDPSKRLKSKQILEHPWIQGNANDTDLRGALEELKKTNSTEKVMVLTTVGAARMYSN